MTALTNAERDKFAAYLEQNAASDAALADQCDKIGERLVAKKLRAESFAGRIIAAKLRGTEFVSVEVGGGA